MARSLLNDEVFEVRETDLSDLGIEPDKDSVYWLKSLTLDIQRVILERHTTKQLNRRTHQKDEVVNRQAVADDFLDAAIVRWEGVLDKGKPAPCTLDQKKKLPVEVQMALVEAAKVGEVTKAEARAESFRQSQDVV